MAPTQWTSPSMIATATSSSSTNDGQQKSPVEARTSKSKYFRRPTLKLTFCSGSLPVSEPKETSPAEASTVASTVDSPTCEPAHARRPRRNKSLLDAIPNPTETISRIARAKTKTLPTLLNTVGALSANPFSKACLKSVSDHAVNACGKQAISGRYHCHPRNLNQDYVTDFLTVLGEGQNGAVFQGRCKHVDRQVAIKTFILPYFWSEQETAKWTKQLSSEVEIALSLDHPNIARLYDVYESKRKLHLVMECLDGGSLTEHIYVDGRRKILSESRAAEATHQMLLALNYLHNQGIVHRDIKPSNFVYDEETGKLKLIDFGFSTHFREGCPMSRACGTKGYKAPELLERNYNSKCDLWSLGITVYRMLMGHLPFEGTKEDVEARSRTGRFLVQTPARWNILSPEARDFITSLIVVDPNKRLSAAECLEHPFIQRVRQSEPVSLRAKLALPLFDGLRRCQESSHFKRACLRLMASALSAEDRHQVADAFAALDVFGEGTIQVKHFLDACGASAQEGSGCFSYSDLLAFSVARQNPIPKHMLEDTFRRLDDARNGYINAKSIASVLGDDIEGFTAAEIFAEVQMNC
eukprot:TRINITY_DN6719_c0_g1_i2.p1 TRINITY_DN6719_c0_g1~~TRINITY_DN6719_c0_g1_i2.p1  ORF type:complete len:583 (+),score=86.25 TRINITY_DN6719_c0_g1_i2:78-1826(+)